MCPGPFGATMITSWPAGGADPAVVDVEAVCEEQRRPRLEARSDLLPVDRGLDLVGEEDRDDLRAAHGLGDGRHGQAGILGRLPGRAPLAQPDFDLDARVVQVEGVGMALAAVADDGDLALKQVEVAFSVDGCHSLSPFS